MVIGYELWLTYKYMIHPPPPQVKNPGYAPGSSLGGLWASTRRE